ncbi:uncharacterized protein LOC128983632 [Macrosteles quadrilineatus]|uniref:uncharacterized protein LOC128983632 n=1 Tax=Macrosteles quadrilineatus TaxID=74068 RepID=UPI0023E3298B|nr:uncharacterized protein LOC128983632 [Macrosteles quadrilineatus]
MTTHSCKTEAPEADAVVPYIRRRVGYIIDGGMKQATYRDLQMIARKFGIPRNLKKSALQMLIKANIDGRHQEANAMLKRIQDARLKRKLSRTGKKLGRSSVKTQVEINNNEPNTTMVQAKESRKSEVSELLCSLLKMRPTSKVTIQNTSLYARYRAFSHGNFNLKNSLGCTSSISNVTSVQQTSATMSVAPHTSQVVAVSNTNPLPAALPLADNQPRRHISQVMAVSNTSPLPAALPLADNQPRRHISQVMVVSNTNPLPAALPLADNQPRRHISQVMAVSNTNPLPAALPLADNQPHRHISQVMAVSNTNPLPAALPLADKRPRATSTVVSGEHNDTLFHHCSTSRQISATLNQVKPYVHNNQLYSNGETNEIFGRMYSFQDQHDYRPFERYQLESQTAMTSFPNANNFMGVQNNCQVSETFFGSQQAYIAYDRSSTHNVSKPFILLD